MYVCFWKIVWCSSTIQKSVTSITRKYLFWHLNLKMSPAYIWTIVAVHYIKNYPNIFFQKNFTGQLLKFNSFKCHQWHLKELNFSNWPVKVFWKKKYLDNSFLANFPMCEINSFKTGWLEVTPLASAFFNYIG